MNIRQSPETALLYEALLCLNSPDEAALFLEDLATVRELQAMAQRLEVARQLRDGRNYQQVCQDTGASTATISRVNKCLLYGSGGYRIALQRLQQHTDQTDDFPQKE